MDRADICCYHERGIRNGTIPNVLIELKVARAGNSAVKQLERYLSWLDMILENDLSRVQVYLLAPSFSCSESSLPKRFRENVQFVELARSGCQRKLG